MARMEVKNVKRQWLVDIRTRQRKTQQEVADSADMSQAGYAGIETGVKTPTVQTAKKIAAVLGFDWTRFFEEPESPPAEDSA